MKEAQRKLEAAREEEAKAKAAKERKQKEKQMKLQQKIQQSKLAEEEADRRAELLRRGSQPVEEAPPAVVSEPAKPKKKSFNVANPTPTSGKADRDLHAFEKMTKADAEKVTQQRLDQSSLRLSEIKRSIDASRIQLEEAERKVREGRTYIPSDRVRGEITSRTKAELERLAELQEAKVKEAISERDLKTSECCVARHAPHGVGSDERGWTVFQRLAVEKWPASVLFAHRLDVPCSAVAPQRACGHGRGLQLQAQARAAGRGRCQTGCGGGGQAGGAGPRG